MVEDVKITKNTNGKSKNENRTKTKCPEQAPQYTSLLVNGIVIGEYICGEDKKISQSGKWAKEQLKKTNESYR